MYTDRMTSFSCLVLVPPDSSNLHYHTQKLFCTFQIKVIKIYLNTQICTSISGGMQSLHATRTSLLLVSLAGK